MRRDFGQILPLFTLLSEDAETDLTIGTKDGRAGCFFAHEAHCICAGVCKHGYDLNCQAPFGDTKQFGWDVKANTCERIGKVSTSLFVTPKNLDPAGRSLKVSCRLHKVPNSFLYGNC